MKPWAEFSQLTMSTDSMPGTAVPATSSLCEYGTFVATNGQTKKEHLGAYDSACMNYYGGLFTVAMCFIFSLDAMVNAAKGVYLEIIYSSKHECNMLNKIQRRARWAEAPSCCTAICCPCRDSPCEREWGGGLMARGAEVPTCCAGIFRPYRDSPYKREWGGAFQMAARLPRSHLVEQLAPHDGHVVLQAVHLAGRGSVVLERERWVRLAEKMRVAPCTPVGMQL